MLCAPGLKVSTPPSTFAVLLDSDVGWCTAKPQKPSPGIGTLWHLALVVEVQAPCNAGSTSTSPSHPHPLTYHTGSRAPAATWCNHSWKPSAVMELQLWGEKPELHGLSTLQRTRPRAAQDTKDLPLNPWRPRLGISLMDLIIAHLSHSKHSVQHSLLLRQAKQLASLDLHLTVNFFLPKHRGGIQTGCEEKFLYHEGRPTLEQASQSWYPCLSVFKEHLDNALINIL